MPIVRLLIPLLAGLLLGLSALAHAAPARVLTLVDRGGVALWQGQFIETLRLALLDRHPEMELNVEPLATGLGGLQHDGELPGWIAQKYGHRRYDVIVANNSAFVLSTIALRDRYWPQAALLVPAVREGQRAQLAAVPRLTGLLAEDRTAATLEVIFTLRPETRHVAVVGHALDRDPYRPGWRRSLAAFEHRASLIDLSGLELPEILQRTRNLPPQTAIYFAAPGIPAGRVLTPREVITRLSQEANAPVFIDASPMLGTGAIGGALDFPQDLARDVASQIDRLADGTPPERIGIEARRPPQLRFDWRALQRWHINEDRLPTDSELLYKPPGLWEAYRYAVLTGLAVVLVQSGLIVALVFERRRRLRAELRTREHLATLARLNRGATLGMLSAALAHEINQPLGAILAHAETAELLLEQPLDTQMQQRLRTLITEIREDDQRAAAVLVRLRAWLANTHTALLPVALNPLIVEVARMLRSEFELRGVELELQLAQLPLVMADGVQVQQVLLNLVRNALDALQQHPVRPRRVRIETARLSATEVEIGVRDNGPGLQGVTPERLFDPFYTTKPEGLGVGLAISAGIVERHGGRLRAEEAAQGGAHFVFTLPIAISPA